MNPNSIVHPKPLPKRKGRGRGRGKRKPKPIAEDIQKCILCIKEIFSESYVTMHDLMCKDCINLCLEKNELDPLAEDIEKCRKCGNEILSESFDTINGPLCEGCAYHNSYYMCHGGY